jgi:hypothetical protein
LVEFAAKKMQSIGSALRRHLIGLPTPVDIAGGDRGDSLKKIEAGQYPRTVKTTLDGLDQRAGLEGRSDNSARDFFFYSPERPRRRWAGSLTWSRRQMRIIQAISLPDVARL